MRKIFCVAFVLCGLATHAYSMDKIRLIPEFAPDNYRYAYEYALLKRALEVTSESDGPFVISHESRSMTRNRALRELVAGNSINVHVAATRTEWEAEALPIRIPIFRGLLGYRIFFINKDDAQKFNQIQNVEELKALRACLGFQWTTTKVFQEANFTVATTYNLGNLYKMIENRRCDYFPRGVNEIFDELAGENDKYPGIAVEDSLVFYFPTPCYFFVSPKYPQLADRIERGMEILVRSGELEKMFNQEFSEAISRANLTGRKFLEIENPLLTKHTPFNRTELWYAP